MLTLAPGLAQKISKSLNITYLKARISEWAFVFACVVAQWMTLYAFVKLSPIKNSRQTCRPARLEEILAKFWSMTPDLRWYDPARAADHRAYGPGFGVRLRLPGYPPTTYLKNRKRGEPLETPHASCQFHLARAQA